jgi:gas vesicle protein
MRVQNDGGVKMAEREDEDGKLGWFLMGAALGAACAILYAPKSGKETRDLITKKAQEASDAVTDTSREIYERGKVVYDKGKQVVDDASALFDRAKGLARG